MIKATNNKIIVRVNMKQKDEMIVHGIRMKTAVLFDKNYRERSPVIAEVLNGNDLIKDGQFIICHHNHFYQPSPYYIYDGVYSDKYAIPFNHTIFATIEQSGDLHAVCGNILGNYVKQKALMDVPPELQKNYIDRLIVTDGGWTPYKAGDLVFTRPNAPYEIVYNFDGHERRAIKVNSEMICGVQKHYVK